MACNKVTSPVMEELSVYTSGVRYHWFTGWHHLLGLSQFDATLNLRNLANNFEAKPAYQTCDVRPAMPDAPTVITAGSYATAAGFTHWRESLSGITTKFQIRLGVGYKQTSGSVALGSGLVEGRYALDQCSHVAGAGRVGIMPGMISGTDINYFPIGEFVPTVGIANVMAAFAYMDNLSTYLEYQLVCRSAIDPRQPNSWQTCEAAWSNPSAASGERNTGTLTLPGGANATTNLLVQFGVAARKKSGAAGNPRGEILSSIVVSY